MLITRHMLDKKELGVLQRFQSAPPDDYTMILNPFSSSAIPAEVDNYHSLFPAEPISDNIQQKSSTFGFVTSCYKAIKSKDGLPYCLRRIHGERVVLRNLK